MGSASSSRRPAKRHAAIVKATASWRDADLLAKLSKKPRRGHGQYQRGPEIQTIMAAHGRSHYLGSLFGGQESDAPPAQESRQGDNMVVAVEYISKKNPQRTPKRQARLDRHPGRTRRIRRTCGGAGQARCATVNRCAQPGISMNPSTAWTILPGGESTCRAAPAFDRTVQADRRPHQGRQSRCCAHGMILLAKARQ